MKINQIIVLKESRKNEGRVALTPDAIAALAKKHLHVLVESGAGIIAGFTDAKYIQAGAHIFKFGLEPFPPHSFILRVKCPSPERGRLENKLFSPDTIMMGFLDPLNNDTTHIDEWESLGLALVSLELLPLIANDPKNAQAAMSHFAGRLALHDALNHYHGLCPKKVTVIGTGPAGMGAAFTARELGLPVQLFGRQEQYRLKSEAAGIRYYIAPQTNPLEFIREHLHDQTIIITAARNIGKNAPLLIDEKALVTLPDHSVIIDLSTGEGGNVIGSKSDQVVSYDRNISIINISGYPKAEPHAASIAFSSCILNILLEILAFDKTIDFKNPILVKAVKHPRSQRFRFTN